MSDKLKAEKSIHSFERTELRVLQNKCESNEDFLNFVADMLGNNALKIERLERDLHIAANLFRAIDNELPNPAIKEILEDTWAIRFNY